VLHCLTGFDGHVLRLATSRSFALMVLQDAKDHATDYEYVGPRSPMSTYKNLEQIGQRSQQASSPLNDAIPEGDDTSTAAWHEANAPRFVASTKLLARRNVRSEDDLIKARQDILDLGETWKLVEAGWVWLHNYDLEVEVTDPKYVSHLIEGHLFATTAFDAWEE
jgi:hypothetical protein